MRAGNGDHFVGTPSAFGRHLTVVDGALQLVHGLAAIEHGVYFALEFGIAQVVAHEQRANHIVNFA